MVFLRVGWFCGYAFLQVMQKCSKTKYLGPCGVGGCVLRAEGELRPRVALRPACFSLLYFQRARLMNCPTFRSGFIAKVQG